MTANIRQYCVHQWTTEAYCNDAESDDAVAVQQCACAALYNLAFDAAITPELEARGAIKLVLDAMKEFPTAEQVRFFPICGLALRCASRSTSPGRLV